MMVTALTSVATKDRHAAHPGTLRLPRKNSRVVVCLFSNHAPTTTMETRRAAVTARSGHAKSDSPENQSGIPRIHARLAPCVNLRDARLALEATALSFDHLELHWRRCANGVEPALERTQGHLLVGRGKPADRRTVVAARLDEFVRVARAAEVVRASRPGVELVVD